MKRSRLFRTGKRPAGGFPAAAGPASIAALAAAAFLSGCAAGVRPTTGVLDRHPWLSGDAVTRVVVEESAGGDPRRIEYYLSGRRLAVETFDSWGESFLDGKIPDGPVREYYEKGVLKSEVFYRGGRRDGPGRYFYREGGLHSEVNWSAGKLEGTARIFRPDGSVAFVEQYREGVLLNRRSYDPRGRLNYEQDYPAPEGGG